MSSYLFRYWFIVLAVSLLTLSGCAGDIPFNQGEKFALEGDWDRAVFHYRQALRDDPENVAYRARLTSAIETATTEHNERAARYLNKGNPDAAVYEAEQALRFTPGNGRAELLLKDATRQAIFKRKIYEARGFMDAGRPNDAVNRLYEILDVDPENEEAKALVEEITSREVVMDESEFDLSLTSNEPITLSFKDANLKDIFEFISKTYGISIIFDEDVKNSKFTVFARDVTFEQALKLMLATNKLFMKKIADDAVIIIPKTKTKIDQYQDLVIKTFYLSNIQAKDMVNILRTMLEIRKIIINETLNAITMREAPDKIALAEKLISANDRRDSEVIIDVEVMTVNRDESLDYGINLPKGVTASYDPTGTITSGGSEIVSQLVTNLTQFKNGYTNEDYRDNVWFSYPSVSANWSKTLTSKETLTNPQIRTLNNKQAKILIGSRVPIQTGTTTGTISTTNFEYREVGIKLTVQPNISLNNSIILKTTLEVSGLGADVDVGAGDTRPRIDTTTVEAELNLQDGETVIIGGLFENEDADNIAGVAGLMDVPILGKIFSTNNIGPNRKRELVMTLTPHIVRSMDIPEKEVSSFWSGTEEAYSTEPLFEKSERRLSQKRDESAAPSQAKADAKVMDEKLGTVGRVLFAPELMPTEVGQEITVDVVGEELDSVFEAPLEVIFNPKLLEFVSATEGNFLNVDGAPTIFEFTPNQNIGLVTTKYTRLGRVGPVSGNGTLFTLQFKCKAAGIATLVIKRNTLKNQDGEPVPADMKTGTIYVR